MAGLSDYLENKLNDWQRGQTFPAAPTNTYAALFTVAPSDAGGGTEVTGGSYARVAIPGALTSWAGTQGAGTTTASTGTSGTTSNNNPITFPAPTAAWGTVVGTALFDAVTGGNMIVYNTLVTNRVINNGDSAPSFAAGTFSIQWDN